MRDMRDALGALGPVDGQNPELNNLTCSMTEVEEGDIVFITSDGVSDNFDPVVSKFSLLLSNFPKSFKICYVIMKFIPFFVVKLNCKYLVNIYSFCHNFNLCYMQWQFTHKGCSPT